LAVRKDCQEFVWVSVFSREAERIGGPIGLPGGQ
jgi:hypothetical protein